MKLHEGASFSIVKRVNDRPWQIYRQGFSSRRDAEKVMESGRIFHAEQCPNDRVEWAIQRIY